jgi:hypothetical protein
MPAKANLVRRAPAEQAGDVSLPKKRGRGCVDPTVRDARQLGNPNIAAAKMAAARIGRHRPRDEVYERNLLKRAVDAGDWATVDAVMMLETNSHLIPCKSGRIRQAEAIKWALEELKRRYPDGLSAPKVGFEIIGGHRMVSIEPSPPDAPRRRPDFKSVEKILRNLRKRG